MKKPMLIFGLVIVIIAAVLVYFFVVRDSGSQDAGLVSSTTGNAAGLQSQTDTSSATGSQVVEILRNLSVIRLDDAVFRNPAFALLSNISITLPETTTQGRRNPFAPVSSTNGTTNTSSVGGSTDSTGTVPVPTGF